MTDQHQDYVTQYEASEIARRLTHVERQVKRVASASADLRNSALDNGAHIPIKDAEGRTTAVIGGQEAGGPPIRHLDGPDPVQPEPVFLVPGQNELKIQHSGLDINNDLAPADFRRAHVHLSQEPDFTPERGTFGSYMADPDGSETHIISAGEWYVGIVWETLSGKLSPMSEPVMAEVEPPVDAQDIEDTLAEAEQIIADAVAEAQTQMDELRDRLDNFEEYDPSDLIAQINQVTEDLAAARQEAAGLVADLADQVDGIKIPDVSGFVTQAEVDAAATAAETAAKEHADLVAQGAEDNAIAEAEAKANAAREAAEAAAKAYTDQQDIETLEAAAADATAKADAAQAAAEAEADRLAKAEAQAAEAEAIRVAAADALAQAEAARDAAIESASTDATAKAEAAQAAAEAYAEAEAQAKADAAQAEAIRQAAADATAKANKAREDAEAAANDYADQQDAQVKIDAAQDAQEKADAAQAEAERLAAEHAELVSTGAKDDAIAEAERLHALAVAEAEAAKTRADEAHTEAGSAWDHADAALNRATEAETAAKQHADNLPKMLGGTGGPVGTAPNGSVWFRRDSNNTVIGRWERIGGSWVQQEVSGQLIDNLEAGKITALNTEFAESVIGKLWTQLAIVDRLVATSAWIGGAMIGEDAVEAKHVVASETLSGKVAEFLKLSVADLVATGAQVDDAVINKLWVDGLVGLSATLARATIASQNLYPDPKFENANQHSPWSVVDGGIEKNGTGSQTGTYYTAETITAAPGDRFRVSANITWVNGSYGRTSVIIRTVRANGSTFNVRATIRIPSTEQGHVEGVYEVPDDPDVIGIQVGFFTESDMTTGARVRVENPRIQNMLDGNLVVENTIHAGHLRVTKDMVGEFASFMHLVTDRMDVNALWADTAWLAAIETASIRLQTVVDDWTTYISGRGMEVISPGGEPTVQLGNFDENGITLYQDGEATASMTDDGHVSGTIVSANDELYYQGTELSEILALEHLPRGVVAERDFRSGRGPHSSEHGVGYVGWLAVPGRMYKITVNGYARPNSSSVTPAVRVRMSHTASEAAGYPTPSFSDEIAGTFYAFGSDNNWRPVSGTTTWEYPNPELQANKPTRAWVTVGTDDGGSSGTRTRHNLRIIVEDIGLSPDSQSGWYSGLTGETEPSNPAPAKTRRTKTYTMNWWRTWWESGLIPPSGVGYREVVQGRTPYFTSAGRFRGMVGFPSMTSDLSGADIEKIEVRVRVIHTHSGSGGRVRLGLHGNTSRPSSFTGHSNLQLTNTHFGRGQEKWVTLPSSVYNGFRSGTHRGVVLYSSSTSSSYYVQASPSRFAIRVTYRK